MPSMTIKQTTPDNNPGRELEISKLGRNDG